MSDQEDQEFEIGDAQSFDCIPTQAGSIKKGGYCMLRGKPCKVTEYCTSKPGKHGSSKATIVGIDIFSGKRYQDGGPTSSNVMVPKVKKTEYEILDINDGFSILDFDNSGSLKEDLRMPTDDKDLCSLIQNSLKDEKQTFVTVISACGQERIIETRNK